MMTEEQARRTWCPFARIGSSTTRHSFGDRVAFEAACACIGSHCQAWRWAVYHDCGKDGITASSGPAAQGYCGLAGQPVPS